MGLSEDICDRMRFDRRARSWTLMDPLGEWTDLRDLKDIGRASLELRELTHQVEAATRRKDWSTVVSLHVPELRDWALLQVEDQIKCHRHYWELVRLVLSTSPVEKHFVWPVDLLLDARPNRKFVMTEEERQILADAPDCLQIFRGGKRFASGGLSWSLEPSVAMWYAQQYEDRGQVLRGWCNKSDVIAIFKPQHEVIVPPACVKIQQRIPTGDEPPVVAPWLT